MLAPLQKLPKNVEDLAKLIAARGLKKLPKVQKIAQSGHTAQYLSSGSFNVENSRRCYTNVFNIYFM